MAEANKIAGGFMNYTAAAFSTAADMLGTTQASVCLTISGERLYKLRYAT